MIESSVSRFDNIIDNSGNTNACGNYFIKCNWQYNSFTVYLTDLSNVWSSNVNTKYIENVLKPQGMSFEQYMILLRKSLIKQDQTKKEFDYRIDKPISKSGGSGSNGGNSDNIELVIIIILSEFDNINVKSSIPLIKLSNSYSSFQHYFDWLFDKYQSLSNQNSTLQQQAQSLQSQFNQSIEQNRLIQLDKERIESNLIEKFIIILNEKKKKIRQYKQTINNLINEQKQQQQPCKCKSKKRNSSSSNSNSPNSKSSPNKHQQTTPKKKVVIKRNFTNLNTDNDSDYIDILDDDNNSNNKEDEIQSYQPTFNNSTPTLDLLGNDDGDSYFNVPTNIRKKFKPTTNTTTTTTTTTTNVATPTDSTPTIPSSSSSLNNTTNTTTTSINSANNTTKIPTRNHLPSSPSKRSPSRNHLTPTKKYGTRNINSTFVIPMNTLAQITPIKAKTKSKIFNFDEHEDEGEIDVGASELLNDL